MTLSFFDLAGKVAIITGGATGIGRGITDGLAEAGATIVVAARRKDMCEAACAEIAATTGAQTLPLRCDITRKEEIETMVGETIAAFGHVDILVNNSGIGGSEKPILEMDENDWDRVLNINLKGIFALSKAVAKRMVAQARGGKIINVASIGAQIAWKNMSAYCASKGGCIQLTKVMAIEWARYGIQVNAILPGYFDTPMNTSFFASEAGKRIINTCIPMRRIARIDEIKGVGVLLASEASSFITGSAFVIDGGQTLQ